LANWLSIISQVNFFLSKEVKDMENLGSTGQQTGNVPTPTNQPKSDQVNQTPPPAPDFRGTKHRFKANGKEIEVPYEELVRRASSAEGAEAARQEAARIRKAEDERKKRWQQDDYMMSDDEIIDQFGSVERFERLAEEAIWKRMNYQKLSPAEKKAMELEQENKRLKEEDEKRKANEKKSTSDALKQDSVKRIDRLITDAMADAKASGIIVADLPEAMELMLDEYMAHLEYLKDLEEQGYEIPKEELSHKAVLENINGRYKERTHNYIAKLPASELRKLLSKEQIAALRQEEVSSLHGGNILAPRTSPAPQKDSSIFNKKKPSTDQRRMKSEDAWKQLDEIHGGRNKR
jgi:hypothetical protein